MSETGRLYQKMSDNLRQCQKISGNIRKCRTVEIVFKFVDFSIFAELKVRKKKSLCLNKKILNR